MNNIYLIGFMGTGKTSTGRLLANRLGYSFVDTDQRIEKEYKMTIKEMFVQHGEAYFREKEAAMVQKLAGQKRIVISTGGGTILDPENRRILRSCGCVISLTAPVEVILERTGRRNTRPLLEQGGEDERRQRVIALLEARKDLYAQSDLMIDTGSLSPLQVVEKITAFIRKRGVSSCAK